MTHQRQSSTVRDPKVLNELSDDAPISIDEVALYIGKSTRSVHRYINKSLLPRPIKCTGTSLAIFYAGDIRRAVAGWRNQ
ncbi:AlpA family transcriptional regulator [Polynucleobacter sp. es-MAR-4]|uniref:helix-turn-helix transcriptional regulator n=1 Tax=Polynucleobacter sp. es-MAR-4 TaxID=1855655 RepID=UPI001C0CC141|nr:winged helix-turn-helix transcriptional regulator [Polynucleobacter sp. es-MAR-4]MBU3637374.1 hypothetical protein [Polynucleobacter sp. es-MAR-4]